MLSEKDNTFYWQGKSPDERREHGVGFAAKNSLLGSIIPPAEGTEVILKLQLQTSAGPVSLISAYAPTLTFPVRSKGQVSTMSSPLPSAMCLHKSLCSFSTISTPELVVLTTAPGHPVWVTTALGR